MGIAEHIFFPFPIARSKRELFELKREQNGIDLGEREGLGTYGDVGAGGEDAHAALPRVGEGGVAEPRREPTPALAPRHVRVRHLHHRCRLRRAAAAGGGARLGGGEEPVLEVGLAVGRLEPPRLLPPQHDLLRRRRLPTAGLRQRRRPGVFGPKLDCKATGMLRCLRFSFPFVFNFTDQTARVLPW